MKNFEILTILALLCFTSALDLPPNFMKCRRSDENFNKCMQIAIQDVLPKLDKGIPEFNFPSAQPLHIPSMTIGEGKGAVHVTQKYTNLNIYDIIKAKIDKVEAKLTSNSLTIDIDATLPDLKFEADYDFNGRILILPIVGKGKATIILNDVKAHVYLLGSEFKKSGRGYYDIHTLKLNLKPSKIIFNFDNLFNGDERLGKEMNAVLNENWGEIWADISSGYEEAVAVVLQNLANIIFKKVPHEKLSPL